MIDDAGVEIGEPQIAIVATMPLTSVAAGEGILQKLPFDPGSRNPHKLSGNGRLPATHLAVVVAVPLKYEAEFAAWASQIKGIEYSTTLTLDQMVARRKLNVIYLFKRVLA